MIPHASPALPATAGRRHPALGFLGWLAITFVAGLVGAVASIDGDAPYFYASLDRPPWAPPTWLFGPVWSVLYLAMAIAAWDVWRSRGFARAKGALTLFVAQLAFNALWTWTFFAWRSGALAMAVIGILLVLVAATVWAFARIRPRAGWLLVPYLAWVSFAAALTYAVWQRNPARL